MITNDTSYSTSGTSTSGTTYLADPDATATSGGTTTTAPTDSYDTSTGSGLTQADAETFVSGLYETYLGREPDASGLDWWVQELLSGAATPTEVESDIANSAEAYQYAHRFDDDITGLYEAELGRSPDDADLTYWSGRMSDGTTYDQVQSELHNSEEAIAYRASLEPPTSSDSTDTTSTYATSSNVELLSSGTQTTLSGADTGFATTSVMSYQPEPTSPSPGFAYKWQPYGWQEYAGSVWSDDVYDPSTGEMTGGYVADYNQYPPGWYSSDYFYRSVVRQVEDASMYEGTADYMEVDDYSSGIIPTFQQQLGRDPTSDELYYWDCVMSSGYYTIPDIANYLAGTKPGVLSEDAQSKISAWHDAVNSNQSKDVVDNAYAEAYIALKQYKDYVGTLGMSQLIGTSFTSRPYTVMGNSTVQYGAPPYQPRQYDGQLYPGEHLIFYMDGQAPWIYREPGYFNVGFVPGNQQSPAPEPLTMEQVKKDMALNDSVVKRAQDFSNATITLNNTPVVTQQQVDDAHALLASADESNFDYYQSNYNNVATSFIAYQQALYQYQVAQELYVDAGDAQVMYALDPTNDTDGDGVGDFDFNPDRLTDVQDNHGAFDGMVWVPDVRDADGHVIESGYVTWPDAAPDSPVYPSDVPPDQQEEAMTSNVADVLTDAISWVGSTLESLANTISSLWNTAFDMVSSVLDGIIDWTKNALNDLSNAVGDALNGENGVGANAAAIDQTVTSAAPNTVPSYSLYGTEGTPRFQAISQKQRNDCWLYSTIAELADRDPQAIKNMITDNGDGTYTVTLRPYGGAYFVFDAKATSISGGLVATAQDGVWPVVLENAYSKYLQQEYNLTDSDWDVGAFPTSAVSLFTGKTNVAEYRQSDGVFSFVINQVYDRTTGSASYNPTDALPTPTYMATPYGYDNLQSDWKAGATLIASTKSTVDTTLGLVAEHAYYITDVSNNMITLNNPYGPNGPAKYQVQVSFDDFRKNFSDLATAK